VDAAARFTATVGTDHTARFSQAEAYGCERVGCCIDGSLTREGEMFGALDSAQFARRKEPIPVGVSDFEAWFGGNINTLKKYVALDPEGALRVGSLGVSLDSVVIAFQDGHFAETIQQLHPPLSLEEV
jgi:hypothetical protein